MQVNWPSHLRQTPVLGAFCSLRSHGCIACHHRAHSRWVLQRAGLLTQSQCGRQTPACGDLLDFGCFWETVCAQFYIHHLEGDQLAQRTSSRMACTTARSYCALLAYRFKVVRSVTSYEPAVAELQQGLNSFLHFACTLNTNIPQIK